MELLRLTRIEPPDWATQPCRHILMGVTVAEYREIQQYRDRLLQAVHREAEAYLNDPRLSFDGDEEDFPNLRRMTGTYYVSDESYQAHRDPLGVEPHQPAGRDQADPRADPAASGDVGHGASFCCGACHWRGIGRTLE